MKTKILLAFLIAGAFASCSEDSSENQTSNSQNLARTEKFSPSLAAYQAGAEGSRKQIVYFENNRVVADSIFDHTGALDEWTLHTYTATTHSLSHRSTASSDEFDRTETFDASGRLSKVYQMPINQPTPFIGFTTVEYTYGSNAVTQEWIDPQTGLPDTNYTTTMTKNTDGLLYYTSSNNGSFSETHFWNNNPVKFRYFNGIEFFEDIDCTYFPTSLPENLQKSLNALNNVILLNGEEADIAENFNTYLESISWNSENHLEYERTFDANNYQNYCKVAGTFRERVRDSETFFYYE